MKKQLICFLLLFTTQLYSQAPSWTWAKSAFSATSYSDSWSVTSDPSGNIFITGSFGDSAEFNNTLYNTTGVTNIFVAKYDSSGSFLWMRQALGVSVSPYDESKSIAADANGNCYITGTFSDTAVFGVDTIMSYTLHKMDVFLAKYDANGNLLWLRSGGGTGDDYGYDLALDGMDNCYITGHFLGAAIFSGDTIFASNSTADLFLVKYDTSGNLVWAKRAGGTGGDLAFSLAVDKNGNSFIAGQFSSPFITLGTSTINFSSGGFSDLFVAKFDSAGNALWGNAITGAGIKTPGGIATDNNGNCYIGGTYGVGSVIFGSTTLVLQGSWDMFHAKYDASGNLVWVQRYGSPLQGTETIRSITADTLGNSYVTGEYIDQSTFNSITLNANTGYDVFIAKVNVSGTVEWVQPAVTSLFAQGISSSIHTDAAGNCFITGRHGGNTAFGNDTLIKSPHFSYGFYIAKLYDNSISGVNETAFPDHTFVYPNPVKDELHISAKDINCISIFDMQGNKVYDDNNFNGSPIKIKSLSPGIYMLKMDNEKSSAVRKFVKQ